MKVVTVNHGGSKWDQIGIRSEFLRKHSPSALSRRIARWVVSPGWAAPDERPAAAGENHLQGAKGSPAEGKYPGI